MFHEEPSFYETTHYLRAETRGFMPRPKKVTTVVTTPSTGNVSPVESQPETLVLTPQEIEAIKQARAGSGSANINGQDFIKALTSAIEATRPFQKKTVMDRKRKTPWTPTDGSAKITKFKRPMFHHHQEIDPLKIHNDVCLMLDKIKVGVYCDGHVKVQKRKDGGLNIEYPIRTASQRLRLVNQFGIRSFRELIQRILDERANPVKYKPQDEDED